MAQRRNYSSIYYDAQTRLRTYSPVNNFNAQSISKGLLDIIATEIERLYDANDYVANSVDPTLANGTNLDKIGFLVGERRTDASLSADYSTTNFYFYIDQKLGWTAHDLITHFYPTPAETDVLQQNGWISTNGFGKWVINIPRGTLVHNSDGSVNYATLASVVLDNANAYVGIISSAPGAASNVNSNVLITNSLFNIPELRKISRYIQCTNSFPISNGSYPQTDNQLRYKIATHGSAFQGNELAVRRVALQVPGVRDILYEKNKYGSGTAHIIVDAISPLAAQGLTSAVQQATQAIAAYGDMIFVDAPKYTGVELSFSIKTDPTNADPLAARDNARSAIIQYINNLPIGGLVVWNQIVDVVMNTPGVIDFIPNYFKIGTYDSINKINTRQIVLRYSNQQAEYIEKFYTDTGLIVGCVA